MVASSTKHYQMEGEHRMVLGKEKKARCLPTNDLTQFGHLLPKKQTKTIHGN